MDSAEASGQQLFLQANKIEKNQKVIIEREPISNFSSVKKRTILFQLYP